jgi:hypothetical protein
MEEDIKQLDADEEAAIKKENMPHQHVADEVIVATNEVGKATIFEDFDKMSLTTAKKELQDAEDELAALKAEGRTKEIPHWEAAVKTAKGRVAAMKTKIATDKEQVKTDKQKLQEKAKSLPSGKMAERLQDDADGAEDGKSAPLDSFGGAKKLVENEETNFLQTGKSKAHVQRNFNTKMHYHKCLGATIRAVSLPLLRSSKDEHTKAWAHTAECDSVMKKTKAIKHVLNIHKMLLQMPGVDYAAAQEHGLKHRDELETTEEDMESGEAFVLSQTLAHKNIDLSHAKKRLRLPGGRINTQQGNVYEKSAPNTGKGKDGFCRNGKSVPCGPPSLTGGGDGVTPKPYWRPNDYMDTLCWDMYECHEGHFYEYLPDNKVPTFPDGLDFCDKRGFGWTKTNCFLNLGGDSSCAAPCWVQRLATKFAYEIENFVVNVVPRWLAEQWETIKKTATDAFNDMKKEAMDALIEVASALGSVLPENVRNAVPVFRYLRFSKIYMKCIINPLDCDKKKMVLPDIEVAFDKFTIGPVQTPSVGKIVEWTFEQGIPLLMKYLAGFLVWETKDFNVPYIGLNEQEFALGPLTKIKTTPTKVAIGTWNLGTFDMPSGFVIGHPKYELGSFYVPVLKNSNFEVSYPNGKLNMDPPRIGDALSKWVPLSPPPGPPPFVMYKCADDQSGCDAYTPPEVREMCTPGHGEFDTMKAKCPSKCCPALCQADKKSETECAKRKAANECVPPPIDDNNAASVSLPEMMCTKYADGESGTCIKWEEGQEKATTCKAFSPTDLQTMCPGADGLETRYADRKKGIEAATKVVADIKKTGEDTAMAEDDLKAKMGFLEVFERKKTFLATNCLSTCDKMTNRFKKMRTDCVNTCFCDGTPKEGDKIPAVKEYEMSLRQAGDSHGNLRLGQETLSLAQFETFITKSGDTPVHREPISVYKGNGHIPSLEEWRQVTKGYGDPTDELTSHLKQIHVTLKSEDGVEREAPQAWAKGSTPAGEALMKEQADAAAEQLEITDPSDFSKHASPPRTGLSNSQEREFAQMEGEVKTSTEAKTKKLQTVKEVQHPAQTNEKARLTKTQSTAKVSVTASRSKKKFSAVLPWTKIIAGNMSPMEKMMMTKLSMQGKGKGVVVSGDHRFGDQDPTEPKPSPPSLPEEKPQAPKKLAHGPELMKGKGLRAMDKEIAEQEKQMHMDKGVAKLETLRRIKMPQVVTKAADSPSEAEKKNEEAEQAKARDAVRATPAECVGCHPSCQAKVVPGVALVGLQVINDAKKLSLRLPKLPVMDSLLEQAAVRISGVEYRDVLKPLSAHEVPIAEALSVGASADSAIHMKADPNEVAELTQKINGDTITSLDRLFEVINSDWNGTAIEKALEVEGLGGATLISVKAEREFGEKSDIKAAGASVATHHAVRITAMTRDHRQIMITHSVYLNPTLAVATSLCGYGDTQARETVYNVDVTHKADSGMGYRLSGTTKVAIHYTSEENYRVKGTFVSDNKRPGIVSAKGVEVTFQQLELSAFCGMQQIKVGSPHEFVCPGDLHAEATESEMTLTNFDHFSVPVHNLVMKLTPDGVKLEAAGCTDSDGYDKFDSSLTVKAKLDGSIATGTLYVNSILDLNKISAFDTIAGEASGQLPSLLADTEITFNGNVVRIEGQEAQTRHAQFAAQLNHAEFDFESNTMSLKMRAEGGPVATVDAPDGELASLTGSTCDFKMDNAVGATFSGGAIVEVTGMGKLDVVYHGGFHNIGMQFLGRGAGKLGNKDVVVWLAGNEAQGPPELLMAFTFTNGMKLEEFASLSTIPNIDGIASLGPNATVAIANMPQSGVSLFSSIKAVITEYSNVNNNDWELTTMLEKFGLPEITKPLAGIFVDAEKIEYDFSGELATLNSFLPEKENDRELNFEATTSLTGYLNPGSKSFHMHLGLGGDMHFSSPEVADIDAKDMAVSFSQTDKFEVKLTGTGEARLTQVISGHGILQDVEVEGSLEPDGAVTMVAVGIMDLEAAEADFTIKMHQTRLGETEASAFISAPRLALGQVARVPHEQGIKYIEKASVFYSNHDQLVGADETLHAGMTLSGVVNTAIGDETLLPLKNALGLTKETGAQIRAWFPISADPKFVAKNFVIHNTMQNKIVKHVRIPHTMTQMMSVVLEGPTVKVWSVGGNTHTTAHSAGSLSFQGLQKSKFIGAELVFLEDGSFQMTGELTKGSIPFTVRATKGILKDVPHSSVTGLDVHTHQTLVDLHKKFSTLQPGDVHTLERRRLAAKQCDQAKAILKSYTKSGSHEMAKGARLQVDVLCGNSSPLPASKVVLKTLPDSDTGTGFSDPAIKNTDATELQLLQHFQGNDPKIGLDEPKEDFSKMLPGELKRRAYDEMQPAGRKEFRAAATDMDRGRLMKKAVAEMIKRDANGYSGPQTGRYGDTGIDGGANTQFNRHVNMASMFGIKGKDAPFEEKQYTAKIDPNYAGPGLPEGAPPPKPTHFNTERLMVMVGPFADGSTLVPMTQTPEVSKQFSSLTKAYLVSANGPVELHNQEVEALALTGKSLHSGLTMCSTVKIASGSALHSLTSDGVFADDEYPTAMTFGEKETKVDFYFADRPVVVSDSKIGENIGEVSVAVNKAVATFTKSGETSAFMFGRLTLSKGALGDEVHFGDTRLDLNIDGGFKLAAMTVPDPEKDAQSADVHKDAENPAIKNPNQAELDAEAKAKEALANAEEGAAYKSVLLVLSKQPNLPLRAVMRIAVQDEAVDDVFDGELAVLKESQSASLMTRLFKKLASNPRDHDAAVNHGDGHAFENEGVNVFMEAAVLHGTAINIQFAGRSHKALIDGVSLALETPLKDACVAIGLPIDLGERRVVTTLSVPWAFYHGSKKDALPTLGFSAVNLGDLTYPRPIGHELTVEDFEVELRAKSLTHPALLVDVRMKAHYQPSKGTEFENLQQQPPAAQELTLEGGVGADAATLELTVTSKGSPTGTWAAAFAEPTVSLTNAKIFIMLSPEKLNEQGVNGVSRIHVEGDAAIKIKEHGHVKVVHMPAQGHLDIEKPQLSKLVCGSGEFAFDVDSSLPSQYRRVQIAYPVTGKDLKEFEMSAADEYKVFNKAAIGPFKDAMSQLGVQLKSDIFEITQMEPDLVDMDQPDSATPFRVKYAAAYFGRPYESSLRFSLEDMAKVSVGTYTMSKGQAYNCALNELIEIGFGYDIAKAKTKCDLVESCKSFMLDPGSKKAWFCSAPATGLESAFGFVTAQLTSTKTALLHGKDMAGLVRIGMQLTFPDLMRKKFEDHGFMYGFKFTPTFKVLDQAHWMVLDVRPTVMGEETLTSNMKIALLGAVKHAMMIPHHDDGGAFTDGKVTSTTIAGAVQAKIAKMKALSEHKIKELTHRVHSEIEKAKQLLGAGDGIRHEDMIDKVEAATEAAKAAVMKGHFKYKDLSEQEASNKIAGYDSTSGKILAEAKSKLEAVSQKLSTAMAADSAAAHAVSKVAKALQKKMPKLTAVHVSKVYVECLYNGKCNAKQAKEPTIKVCFTEIGCSEVELYPGTMVLQEWIKTTAKQTMVKFMRQYLTYKDVTVQFPDFVQSHDVPVSFNEKHIVLKEPVKVISEKRVLQIPTGVNEASLNTWASQPAEQVAVHEIAQHDMPPSLSADREMNKMFKHVHGTEKDTMEMGIMKEEKKENMDVDTNMEKGIMKVEKKEKMGVDTPAEEVEVDHKKHLLERYNRQHNTVHTKESLSAYHDANIQEENARSESVLINSDKTEARALQIPTGVKETLLASQAAASLSGVDEHVKKLSHEDVDAEPSENADFDEIAELLQTGKRKMGTHGYSVKHDYPDFVVQDWSSVPENSLLFYDADTEKVPERHTPDTPEIMEAAVAAWSSQLSAFSGQIGENNVVQGIMDLKAYCIGAKPVLEAKEKEEADKTDDGPLIELIKKFGVHTNNDIVTDFAQTIGNLEVAFPTGIGHYIIDSINTMVLSGKNPVLYKERDNKNGYGLDHKAMGLTYVPHLFDLLAIPSSTYLSIHGALSSGKPGKAAELWGKSKLGNVLQDRYDKLEAQWASKQEAYLEKVEASSKLAVHASYEKSVEANKSSVGVVPPLPMASIAGAHTMREKVPFKMPSVAELKKQAMSEAKHYMKQIASGNLSTDAIVKSIERQIAGTTVEFTTDHRMFSGSHQSPTISIVGTKGKIQATVEAMPLPGKSINRTYTAENGKSIGEVRYVVITNDVNIKNPWLCSGFRVQVGHGNPMVPLLPQGRIHTSFWLDGASGKQRPYYGLPKKKDWLMAPRAMNKKKSRRKYKDFDVGHWHVEPYPMHTEMLKGPQCGHHTYGDFKFGVRMETCNSFSLCQGYHTFWDHKSRKWFDISSCHDSGIDTLKQCGKKAENSGNCNMDYLQWSNGTNGHGKYCFCNPKGKTIKTNAFGKLDDKNFFDHKKDADVMYPFIQGLTAAEKEKEAKAAAAAPEWTFSKKLSGLTPNCPDIECVTGTFSVVRDKCGATDACDGFTFPTNGKVNGQEDGNAHKGCLLKRCIGNTGQGKAKGDDYYERDGFGIVEERSEKARTKELTKKHIAKKLSDEKAAKSSSKANEGNTKSRMVRDTSREIEEKWTRPYWDVPNGYGNCTTVTDKGDDACALYADQHCSLHGSQRIDAKQNCHWEGSAVIYGCNYRCRRHMHFMPKGWKGPPAVSQSDANYQDELFKDANNTTDLSPWGEDAYSASRKKTVVGAAIHEQALNLLAALQTDRETACATAMLWSSSTASGISRRSLALVTWTVLASSRARRQRQRMIINGKGIIS